LDIFQNNLDALRAKNLLLARQIEQIQTNEKFEVFVDEKEPLNINIADKNLLAMYTNPLEEVVKKYTQLGGLLRYPYLYFFGLGNSVLFKMLLQNESVKRIIVVEPELELIYIALNLLDFSKEILEDRFIILYMKDFSFANSIEYFKNKSVVLYSKLYTLNITNGFYENYQEDILEANRIFLKAINHSVLSLGNSSSDTMIGIEHHRMNLHQMIQTPTLEEFYQRVKVADTAIIVATGPSLNKQLDLLKKIQQNVVLFCVDASLPILYEKGIKPDVVVSMERVVDTAEFFKQTSKEAHEDVIFALSSVQHPDVFKNIKAGIQQISMRGYGFSRVFKADDWGYIKNGVSAANMAYELICKSGFKKCILVGQDLAYAKDGLSHAQGHVFGSDEIKNDLSDNFVQAYGGKEFIKTTDTWNMFRNYYETQIEETKESIVTINATEGGARIQGALEMPLCEVIEKYIDTDFHKNKIVLKPLSKEKIEAKKKELDKKVSEIENILEENLKNTKELFLEVAKYCEELEKNGMDEVDFDYSMRLSDKIESIKKLLTDGEFADFFSSVATAFIVHQEMEIAKIVVRDIKNEQEKKEKLVDWIKIHKFWLFSFAGCLQAVQTAMNRKGSQYKSE